MEEFFENDTGLMERVLAIRQDDPYAQVILKIEELERYVFGKYCLKGYDSVCEPEFCSHALNRECHYLGAIEFLSVYYGIDLVRKAYRPRL